MPIPVPRVDACPFCGADTEVFKRRNALLRLELVDACLVCRRRIGGYFHPQRGLSQDDLDCLPSLPDMRPNDPDVCPVCDQLAMLEEHHLAPRALFGVTADRWPTALVCRPCHEQWHAVMGYPIGGAAIPESTVRRLIRTLGQLGHIVSRRAAL